MSSASLVRSALVSPPVGDGGGPPLSERGWRITVAVLHVVFAVFVVVAAVDAVVEEDGARQAVLLAALAVLALAYVAFGARALAGRDHRRSAVYLLVLVAVVSVLAWVLPELLFLLFLGFTQVWFMVPSLLGRHRLDPRAGRGGHRRSARARGTGRPSRCTGPRRRSWGWSSASRWGCG